MVLLGIIVLVALLLPIISIVADSPIGRALGRRIEGPEQVPPDVTNLAKKVELLESEVDDLTRQVEALQEETAFLQRLIEDAPPRQQLPPAP
jgi:chaperonin cofactor prefoldin